MDNIKRLYRSDDAMIAGVCAGFAEYLGLDPTVFRIFAIIMLVLLFGIPAILYLLLIIIMPKQPLDNSRPIDIKASVTSEMSAIRSFGSTPGAAWVSSNSEAFDAVDPTLNGTDGRQASRGINILTILGVLLAGFAIIVLLGFFVDPFFWDYWPLIIILVGLIILCTPGYNGWRVSRAGYSILIVTVGIVIQLWRLGYYPLIVFWNTFWTFWPAGLIGIGLMIIGGVLRRDILKLASTLLISLALVIGVWSFGQMGGSYKIPFPLFEYIEIDLPDSPFPWR
ncbi:MAG: PspC domain-containing protein [Coriobacteriales bacterium]|nr:PspC domain-containing protein [Coriobacteriales bacterium]